MWEKQYKKGRFYWGLKSESELKEVLKYAPKDVVLDIGAGEGKLGQGGSSVD